MRASTEMKLLLAVLVGLPAVAEAAEVRRACRATGYFLFTFHEVADGRMTSQTKRIDILPSDMEVVATSAGQTWSTVTDAKRWACAQAASCFARQAAGTETCGSSPLNVIWETIRKPTPIGPWRRKVGCNHALAGNVPGLSKTGRNTVTLAQTKIVATASRDGITRNGDQTVQESNHLCWGPTSSGGARPAEPTPSRTPDPDRQPSRTDPGRQPVRTDPGRQPTRTDPGHAPSRTNAPSPVKSINITVTPQIQRGKCPASVQMKARLELRQPVEVRWWVTGEEGYVTPKYVRSFNQPEASLTWRRHIDPQPEPADTTFSVAGGKPRAPVHQGYFQLHLETVPRGGRSMPLGETPRERFTVDCNAESARR